MTNETDKSIRLEVRLYVDGKPLDIDGLIAIPGDRLKCFEDLALQLQKARVYYDKITANPHDIHSSTELSGSLPQIMKKLDTLLAVWSPAN